MAQPPSGYGEHACPGRAATPCGRGVVASCSVVRATPLSALLAFRAPPPPTSLTHNAQVRTPQRPNAPACADGRRRHLVHHDPHHLHRLFRRLVSVTQGPRLVLARSPGSHTRGLKPKPPAMGVARRLTSPVSSPSSGPSSSPMPSGSSSSTRHGSVTAAGHRSGSAARLSGDTLLVSTRRACLVSESIALTHTRAGYYPVRTLKEADLPADRKYVFGYHPHGIISMGALCTFATEATGFSELFPGIKPHLLTLGTSADEARSPAAPLTPLQTPTSACHSTAIS